MEFDCKVMTMSSEDIEVLEKINYEAFPDDERIELPKIFSVCELTDGEVLGWYADGELIGFSMTHRNDTCVYLNFFAIKNSERCKGYGHKVLQMLQDRYSDVQLILDFEVLDAEADNYEIRKRRKAFYLRNGMCETGYYTKLYDNYFELVCNHGKLNVDDAKSLLEKIHSVMPELSGKLYLRTEVESN